MKANLFSRKSSIFLLGILGIVLFLSLFAKSTIIEGNKKPPYSTQDCEYYHSNNKSRQESCKKEYAAYEAAKVAAAAAAAAAENSLKELKTWTGGEWYNSCVIDYNNKNTEIKNKVTANCKDNKNVYKKTVAHYKDCKKYANNEGVINLINNNGKFECDRKIYK